MENEKEIIKRRLIEAIESLMNQSKKEPVYFNEAHRKNSEAAMKYTANCKKHPLSFEEASKQQERNSKDPIPEIKETITYLNDYHRKNSEAAMKYIAKSKTSKIDWEKELERLKYNSKDHPVITEQKNVLQEDKLADFERAEYYKSRLKSKFAYTIIIGILMFCIGYLLARFIYLIQ